MTAAVHHIELWVPDIGTAVASWGWILGELGWSDFQDWPVGHSRKAGADATYLVVEQSPAMSAPAHDRLRPGLNHLALNAENRKQVDRIVEKAAQNGWTLMFADKHPHAGGPDHYAAFLHNDDGYELEIVASD